MKKCKGTHKLTFGYGCDEFVSNENKNRVYGLGKSCGCFQSWIKTEKGQKYLDKHVIPKYKSDNFSYEKEKKKQSNQNYRSKILQPLINSLVKLIDYDQNCIVKNLYYRNCDAGHYFGVGSNETTSLNLHNIFNQSINSNRSKGGEPIKFLQGIIREFGQDYANYILTFKQIQPLHLTLEEMKEKASVCRKIIKELEGKEFKRTNEQRILLRNKYNLILDIYPLEFSVFDI